MASTIPKCRICKDEINKKDQSSFIKKSSGYFHVACESEKGVKNKKTCSFCNREFESEKDIVKRGSLTVHQSCLEQYHQSREKFEVKVRVRTCPKCKEKVNPLDVEALDTGTATYHKACYESIQRQKKNREELLDYIALKYNVEFPTGFILKQITDYHNKRGYSYKAMLVTLKYMFDVEKVPTKEGVGLGLIPFYFEKAKSYHQKLRQAGNSANNVTINNKTVKIKAVAPVKANRVSRYDLSSM